MTSLTFYGGVNEVGGNKILLEDKDTKVFLDFGMSFGQRGAYFDEFMSPRLATGIKDLLDIAKGIDARMLFPIHTDHPDAYKKITDRITIVEKAKKYEL